MTILLFSKPRMKNSPLMCALTRRFDYDWRRTEFILSRCNMYNNQKINNRENQFLFQLFYRHGINKSILRRYVFASASTTVTKQLHHANVCKTYYTRRWLRDNNRRSIRACFTPCRVVGRTAILCMEYVRNLQWFINHFFPPTLHLIII
jgi:hypothetical protein